MTRSSILSQIKQFFDVEELVCNHTYKRWLSASWQFLDTEYLHCLLIIRRDILKSPMICNHSGANQRGLRCNLCEITKGKKELYLSSHLFGKAGDFTVSGMTALEARELIKKNAHLLPCNIRLEGGVSWLHFDVLPQFGVTQKVHEF